METFKEKLDFEKIWFMFQETDKKFQQSERMLTERFQETNKKFQESERMLTERFQETEKILSEKFQETDKELKELIKISKEQDQRVKDLNKLFVNHWGQLVETLVEGRLIEILRNRNIPVNQTLQRHEAKYNGKDYEFDIIALNGSDAVIVEVKTTLNVKYVKDYLEKLKIVKEIIPVYKNFNIIGAMAYIKSNEQSDKFAQSKGLFTIRATGDSAFITNSEDFNPKTW